MTRHLFFSIVLSRAAWVVFKKQQHLQKWRWSEGTEILLLTDGKSGSWYPKDYLKGDGLVPDEVMVLWAYSVQASWELK